MKSIKTMLLGLALLIIAACGATLWVAGAGIGAIMFFTGVVIGLLFCFKGYFSNE